SFFLLFLQLYRHHRALHSFPTRRSSDLRRQLLKDYAIFPLLAGPFFVPVMAGNLGANLIRNVWAFIIIFCGHFTERVETFPESVDRKSTRLNSSHVSISYAVFCLKKKKQ